MVISITCFPYDRAANQHLAGYKTTRRRDWMNFDASHAKKFVSDDDVIGPSQVIAPQA